MPPPRRSSTTVAGAWLLAGLVVAVPLAHGGVDLPVQLAAAVLAAVALLLVARGSDQAPLVALPLLLVVAWGARAGRAAPRRARHLARSPRHRARPRHRRRQAGRLRRRLARGRDAAAARPGAGGPGRRGAGGGGGRAGGGAARPRASCSSRGSRSATPTTWPASWSSPPSRCWGWRCAGAARGACSG